MKVLIIHDHIPESPRVDETDALVQVDAVRHALEQLGHEWMTLGLTLDLEAARAALERLRPDLVFNICESLGGYARFIHVPSHLLDSLRIPYTGTTAEGMMLTSNKLLAKRMMQAANIPTPGWHECHRGCTSGAFVSGRHIIKSVWEHASIGLDENAIMDADSPSDLDAAMQERLPQLGGESFAEAFIDGREFNLALLSHGNKNSKHVDPEILPPAEIDFKDYPDEKPKIVGYSAKWNEGSFEYTHTPQRYDFPAQDGPLISAMKTIAMDCWRLFRLRGYARVDFRVDRAGKPWVLEVNANPCLSPDAGFAAALERGGIQFAKAIERILGDV